MAKEKEEEKSKPESTPAAKPPSGGSSWFWLIFIAAAVVAAVFAYYGVATPIKEASEIKVLRPAYRTAAVEATKAYLEVAGDYLQQAKAQAQAANFGLVTEALTKLSEAGLVKHQKYSGVELTAKGARIARYVNRRHEVLRRFLAEILNVHPEIAEQDACGMEHALSAASLSRMAKFVEFLSNCPLGTPECLKGFNYYFEHGEREQGLLASCTKRGATKMTR